MGRNELDHDRDGLVNDRGRGDDDGRGRLCNDGRSDGRRELRVGDLVEVGRQLLNVERDIGWVGRVRVARFRVGRYSHLSPPPLARFSSVITISVKETKTVSRPSSCNLARSGWPLPGRRMLGSRAQLDGALA